MSGRRYLKSPRRLDAFDCLSGFGRGATSYPPSFARDDAPSWRTLSQSPSFLSGAHDGSQNQMSQVRLAVIAIGATVHVGCNSAVEARLRHCPHPAAQQDMSAGLETFGPFALGLDLGGDGAPARLRLFSQLSRSERDQVCANCAAALNSVDRPLSPEERSFCRAILS